ncbi:MAG: GlsB/YeaQ/YmgE family stress response membrane protein [Patescibacteria group bacterium]
MSWIIVIIVGALVGWLASIMMKTDEQQGLLANVIVGVVGALLAQLIFGLILGIGSAQAAGDFSIWGVVWGVIGAVILIWVLRALNLFK